MIIKYVLLHYLVLFSTYFVLYIMVYDNYGNSYNLELVLNQLKYIIIIFNMFIL